MLLTLQQKLIRKSNDMWYIYVVCQEFCNTSLFRRSTHNCEVVPPAMFCNTTDRGQTTANPQQSLFATSSFNLVMVYGMITLLQKQHQQHAH